eukprot:12191019-Prorocentrum_lima.AAC.1
MTSSLVGSEMCIRDSSPPVKQTATPAARKAFELFCLAAAVRGHLEAPTPVSYTHLTLPTICSV